MRLRGLLLNLFTKIVSRLGKAKEVAEKHPLFSFECSSNGDDLWFFFFLADAQDRHAHHPATQAFILCDETRPGIVGEYEEVHLRFAQHEHTPLSAELASLLRSPLDSQAEGCWKVFTEDDLAALLMESSLQTIVCSKVIYRDVSGDELVVTGLDEGCVIANSAFLGFVAFVVFVFLLVFVIVFVLLVVAIVIVVVLVGCSLGQ